MDSAATNNTHVACDSFKPIRWSKADTTPTQRQVIGHNATGKALCKWRPTRG